MNGLKYLVIAALLIAPLLAFVTPIGPVPGFFIGGTETAAPEPWPDTSTIDEIRLQVPGTPPRVVIIWVVDYLGDLHVVGAPDSGWVTRLGEGGPAKLRIGDSTYAVNATRLRDGWEPVVTAYVEKYRADYPDIIADLPPLNEAAGQFALFRLDRA